MATLPNFSALVLNAIYTYFATMGYEEGFSDLTSSDIAKTLDVSPKAVNAALARLNADSLVSLEEWDSNGKTQHFIHLEEAGRKYIQETATDRAIEAKDASEVDKKRAKQDAKNARARRRRAAKKAAQK